VKKRKRWPGLTVNDPFSAVLQLESVWTVNATLTVVFSIVYAVNPLFEGVL
jgi:hypothetical protein